MVMDKSPSDATDFSEASISNESAVNPPEKKVLAYEGYSSPKSVVKYLESIIALESVDTYGRHI